MSFLSPFFIIFIAELRTKRLIYDKIYVWKYNCLLFSVKTGLTPCGTQICFRIFYEHLKVIFQHFKCQFQANFILDHIRPTWQGDSDQSSIRQHSRWFHPIKITYRGWRRGRLPLLQSGIFFSLVTLLPLFPNNNNCDLVTVFTPIDILYIDGDMHNLPA